MSMELPEFTEGLKKSIGSMTVKELREREIVWRALWGWLDESVKYWLLKIGADIRIVRRDYKNSLGELGQVSFEPKEAEIRVYEKTYNYNDGQYYLESKYIKIPFSAIVWHEIITDSELQEKLEPEVAEINNDEEEQLIKG